MGAVGERVVWEDGLVLDYGLFLASDLMACVISELSSSPLGYGLRRLTSRELGNLCDVPILLLDSLLETDVGLLMTGICATPLSKLLHTGTDPLLTAIFWGGGRERTREFSERTREFSVPLGPWPLSDQELGLS
jgi:hypothetical protein